MPHPAHDTLGVVSGKRRLSFLPATRHLPRCKALGNVGRAVHALAIGAMTPELGKRFALNAQMRRSAWTSNFEHAAHPKRETIWERPARRAVNEGRNVALLQRAGHGVNHAAGQKIDGGLAAELIAGAAFDQARSEAALHRRGDMRAAGFGPDQSQIRFGVFRRSLPSPAQPCRCRSTARHIWRRWSRSRAGSSTAPPPAAATAAPSARTFAAAPAR